MIAFAKVRSTLFQIHAALLVTSIGSYLLSESKWGAHPRLRRDQFRAESKNGFDHFSAVQAVAIYLKFAELRDPQETPERSALALDPSDSHPLQLKCSKCKKHFTAESQLKTAVEIAEVPFLQSQKEHPCNPDEFLSLSNATANIKEDLNELRQILQATFAERDVL